MSVLAILIHTLCTKYMLHYCHDTVVYKLIMYSLKRLLTYKNKRKQNAHSHIRVKPQD